MTNQPIVTLMSFYGLFLISCGVASVIFIGSKAKTAVASGSISGILSLFIAYLNYIQVSVAPSFGLLLSIGLFTVFSWRLSKTLSVIFKLIPTSSEELNSKGIAFLIIGLMAVVSIMVFVLQLLFVSMIAF